MKEVAALVVGKSGAGKSEFIGSFSENSNLINSSGGGQTTRTSVEYNYHINNVTPYVQVNFLSEEQFIEKRMSQIEEIKIPIGKYDLSIKEQVLEIEGFFNYKEFDFEDKRISNQIDDIWEDILPLELQKDDYTYDEYLLITEKIKKKMGVDSIEKGETSELLASDSNSINNVSNYKIVHIVEHLLQATYRILRDSIKDFPNKFELISISEENKRRLTYCLKVDDDNHSVTGIILKVVINDNVKPVYRELFSSIGIKKLTFIDTYGLDHEKLATAEVLQNRYNILFNEFPNIETVLFVRALGSDSPTDLATAIPLIYASNPAVVPYVVFTKIDENKIIEAQSNKSKIDLVELNKHKPIKAVDYFLASRNERTIKKILSEANIPEILIESRYEVLLNNLMPYCSIDKECYIDNNKEYVEQLFSSILNKEHLGKSLVNIDALESLAQNPEFMVTFTRLLKEMFIKAAKDWSYYTLQRRTIGANRKRLEADELGYDGTYLDSWQSRFSTGYNQVFSKISANDFEQLFKVNQSTNESAAIQEILNQFSKYFLRFGNFIERGNINANTKFKTIVVESNPEYMKYSKLYCDMRPIHSWLSKVYSFGDYFDKVETEIYDVVLSKFLKNFIKDCRDHNVRILRKSIKSAKGEYTRIVEDYFLNYDRNMVDKENFLASIKTMSLTR
jgi:GTPase SAR1 family protein